MANPTTRLAHRHSSRRDHGDTRARRGDLQLAWLTAWFRSLIGDGVLAEQVTRDLLNIHLQGARGQDIPATASRFFGTARQDLAEIKRVFEQVAWLGDGGRGGNAPAEKPVKRDAHGIIMGGIRLAEVDAPVALESGELCGLGGTHVPFDTATVKKLYPTHAAYVAKVTAASNAAVKAGFLLRADAAQTIDAAKRSIVGLGLDCGALCADVAQFPNTPSSSLLSKQTSYLMIKGGDALVKIMDEVSRLIAQRQFLSAATRIDAYIAEVKQLRSLGNMPAETETLLVSQATTLKTLVQEKAK